MPDFVDINGNSRHIYYANFKGESGGSLQASGSSGYSDPITAERLDILAVGEGSVVFLNAGSTLPLTSVEGTNYPAAVGQPYRFPWITGDRLAVVAPSGETADVYWHPVK